jgi:hypothetical protein
MGAIENQIGSNSRKSDDSEILHELFHLPSKYAHFVFGDWAYLGTRHHSSLYETVPTHGVNQSGAFQTGVPIDAFSIRGVLLRNLRETAKIAARRLTLHLFTLFLHNTGLFYAAGFRRISSTAPNPAPKSFADAFQHSTLR